MTNLPKRPNFKRDSDNYFLWTYRRGVEEQHHIVAMDRWKLPELSHPRNEILEDWTKRGLGRIILEEDGYGTHTHFSISDAGVAHGLALERKLARQAIGEKLRRNGIPLFSAIAAFVAAVAAVAAAYFSYLLLPGK